MPTRGILRQSPAPRSCSLSELSKPGHDLTGQLVHELKATRTHAFRQRPPTHARAGQLAFESKGNGLCHKGQSSTCTSDPRTSTTRFDTPSQHRQGSGISGSTERSASSWISALGLVTNVTTVTTVTRLQKRLYANLRGHPGVLLEMSPQVRMRSWVTLSSETMTRLTGF